MAFVIKSDRLDCKKSQGDSLTEKELLAMGANIDALIAGGHIASDVASSKPVTEEGATLNG